MITAFLTPLAAGGLLGAVAVSSPGASSTSIPQAERFAELVATATLPPLYIEGRPYWAEATLKAEEGDRPAEIPGHLLEPSGWLLNSKALVRRRSGDSRVVIQQGQSLQVRIDLAPFIEARLDGDHRDFRLQFAEAARDLEDTFYLAQTPAGIDFTELPREQLDDYQVVFETSAGVIWLELWPDVAPNHVRNFLDLCATGFYDGANFHRVIPGFMIQGGSAREGAPAPRTVGAEFSDRSHEAGVLSAARNEVDINSASSEFFIIHRASRELDGNYSAFGRVILGMDAVDEIAEGAQVHERLLRNMLEQGIEVETEHQWFDFVVNRPNPPQLIRQALIVKASKSRPRSKKEDEERR